MHAMWGNTTTPFAPLRDGGEQPPRLLPSPSPSVLPQPPSPSVLPLPPLDWFIWDVTPCASPPTPTAPVAPRSDDTAASIASVVATASGRPAAFAAYHIFGVSRCHPSRPPTRTQVLEQRRWDAAAQVRRAQAERASRRGAMPRRQPQGYTVWEAMQGVTLLERDELVRERGRVRVQVEEDAALARAIHISQLDAVWPPGPETDLAGALPRPLTPLERHTAMADSGSRANSASELGLPATPVTGRGDAIAPPLAFASSVSSPPSPLPSPSPPWSLTHAAWNALMHALWGNTPTPQPEAPAAPARNSAGGAAGWVLNVDWDCLAARARAEAEVVAGLLDEAAAELVAEVAAEATRKAAELAAELAR